MNTYFATDPGIRVLGRTKVQNPLPLFWTASGVEFNVNGSELTFVLSADHSIFEQWIRVELDGASMIRMPLNKGENRVTVYRGLNPEETRHVRLFKEVQAMPNDPDALLLFERIETDGTLQALLEPELKIEFIGDSLTSGEGLAGAQHLMDWQALMFSTQDSYTQLVSKALHAECRVISQSGWGVLRSWDADYNCAIPPYYEKVCGVLKGERNASCGAQDENDFDAWKPDYIYVNLGSNDQNDAVKPLTAEHRAEIGDAAYRFVQKLRALNPDAKILYCCGIGHNKVYAEVKEKILKYIADTRDEKVKFMEIPGDKELPGDPSDYIGSRSHPGPKANRVHAECIIKEIREW